MNRFGWSSKVAGFLLLLNFLACAGVAGAQLTANPSSMSFGTVQTGASSSQSLIVGNSGKPDVTITLASVTGAGFSLSGPTLPATLASGQSATFRVLFAPQSAGSTSGLLSLATSTTSVRGRSGKHTSVSTATTTVVLSGSGATLTPAAGTPGNLTANPGSLNFSGVQVGNSQTLFAAVSNSGGSAVTVSQASTTGTGFAVAGLNLPLTLAAGQSVTFSVSFTPPLSGSASGSVVVNSDAANTTLTLALAGTGTAQGQVAVTPVSSDFGNVTVGNSKVQSGTLTASGSAVTLSSVNVTGPEFSISGIGFPLTLAAGQSVPFTMTFVPRSSGVATATVAFAGNASNTATQSLTGTGVAPVQHSVNLSWDTAAEVVGYNVYRAGQAGGPYAKINSVINASTNYSDTAVQAGQNYYYVTTSVSAAGVQSIYSNEIQVTIPNY